MTPLGAGRQATWDGLLRGIACGQRLNPAQIDHHQELTRLLKRPPGGAPVDHQAVQTHLQEQLPLVHDGRFVPGFADTWGQDCLNNMLAWCLVEAVQDARLSFEQLASPRVGCVVGTSKPSLRAMERKFQDRLSDETTHIDHLWQSGFMPDSPLRMVQSLTAAQGPFGCPVAACATGLFSFLEAFDLIATGQCDVCVAGSGDASLRASVLSGFHRLGVTSRAEDPVHAGRPFDQERDGFIIGEGAGLLVLESARHAAARSATPYARVKCGRVLTDCTGMTQVDTSGEIVARVIDHMGDIRPDIVSLHGTATPTNDLAEARGLAALQSRLGRQVPAFSIKGAIGHTLGAAASIELAATCLALKHNIIPGTVNHLKTDENCRVDVTADCRQLPVSEALKLSLGFGGHVAGCVLTAP